MGKAKKTRKFATMKRVMSAKDSRLYAYCFKLTKLTTNKYYRKKNQDDKPKPKKDQELVREV